MSAAHPLPTTVLVTGATDGIGRATAMELSRRGVRVLVHGRRAEKVDRTVTEVAGVAAGAGVPPPAGLVADFASLAEVRRLSAEVGRHTAHLDVVVHNAGVYRTSRHLTMDGFEETLAVNHLAPFALTYGLRGLLRASAPARVVTVASVAHLRGRIHLDDLNLEHGWEDPDDPRSGYTAYAQSKLANVMFALALARRWRDDGVASLAVHPGVVSTKLLRTGFGITGTDAVHGAATSVWAATAPELEGVTGAYLSESSIVESSRASHDQGVQEALWSASARMVGIDWP